MASGSIPMTCGKAWRGRIDWNSTPYEDGNYSVVNAYCYTWKTDGYPTSGGGWFEGSLNVGAESASIYFDQANTSETLVASITGVIVYHDSDGIGKVAISASITKGHSTSLAGVTLSGSQTVTLDAISVADASTVSLGADTVQMGKNLLITMARDDSACVHDLSYTFGGVTKAIASSVGSSYAWTVPDLAALCNDAVSGVCTVTCKTYRNGSYLGATTDTVTLTVPDATVPVIAGSEVTLGQDCTIACQRNSTNFTLRLEFEFKDLTVSITEGQVDSASWMPEYDLAKQIPNLTYGTGTLKCTTMNGTAEVGTETATIRAIVPENDVTRPDFTLDGLVLSPISDLGEEFAGLYLRGKTGLKAEFTAESTYSTIQTYSVTVGSISAEGNPAAIDLLVNEGDVKVTAKVTDARGFSTTVSTTVYILPYRKPKVTPYTGFSNVVCERALDTGELNPNGTYLAIKAGKSYSSVVLDGVEKNKCVLRYRWKPSGADAFGDWITLLAEGSEETEVSMLIGNVVASLSVSYDVQISAVDALGGEHSMSFPIMTAAISFVLYDGVDGAGFGKYPEASGVVDIASHMTLLVRGKLVVLGADWISLGLASGVSESAFPYGRKEDTGCHYQVTEGNHVYAAFNCAFAYAGTAAVINETPIPEEYRPLRTVCSLCPVNDRGMALVSVNPDGYIRVEWVQKLTDTVETASAEVIWIDGYLDYWT